jgi:hypothetical protein
MDGEQPVVAGRLPSRVGGGSHALRRPRRWPIQHGALGGMGVASMPHSQRRVSHVRCRRSSTTSRLFRGGAVHLGAIAPNFLPL